MLGVLGDLCDLWAVGRRMTALCWVRSFHGLALRLAALLPLGLDGLYMRYLGEVAARLNFLEVEIGLRWRGFLRTFRVADFLPHHQLIF